MLKLFKSFLSMFGIYAFGSMGEKALSVLFIPIYTTYLGPKDFGIIALLEITVELVAKFAQTPVISACNRFYYNPSFREEKKVFIFNLFLFFLLKLAIIGILFFVFAVGFCEMLFDDSSYYVLFELYAYILVFSSINAFFFNLLRLIQKAPLFVFFSFVRMFIQAGSTLYFLIGAELGLYSLAYARIVTAFCILLLSVHILIRNFRWSFRPRILLGPLRFGYPLLPSGYSNFAIQIGDRYILNIFTTIASVGIYNFGNTIASVINIAIVLPLNQVLGPMIYMKEEEPEIQRRFVSRLSFYYFSFSLFLGLIVSLFAKEIIALLVRNDEFLEAWSVVPFLAYGHVFHGLASFTGVGMTMKNKSSLISMSIIVAATVNVGLNFLLIPFYGIVGAAFATMISFVVLNIIRMYYSKKLYGLSFAYRRLIGLCFLTGVLNIVGGMAESGESSIFGNILKICCICVYLLCCFSFVFEKNELKAIHRQYKEIRSKFRRSNE